MFCTKCSADIGSDSHCAICGTKRKEVEKTKGGDSISDDKLIVTPAGKTEDDLVGEVKRLTEVIAKNDNTDDDDKLKAELTTVIEQKEALARSRYQFNIDDLGDIGGNDRQLKEDIGRNALKLYLCAELEGYDRAEERGLKNGWLPVPIGESLLWQRMFGGAKRAELDRALKGLEGSNFIPSARIAVSKGLHDKSKGMRFKTQGAMDTIENSDLVPLLASSFLWNMVREGSNILRHTRTRPMSTKIETDNLEGVDPEWFLIDEQVADTSQFQIQASTVPVTPIQWELKKVGARTLISYELLEDAIMRMEDYINFKLSVSAQEMIDYAIVRSDADTGANANINLNDGTPGTTLGAKPKYLVGNGWDKACIDGVGGNNTTLTAFDDDDLFDLVIALGKYAQAPEKNAFFTDINGYFLIVKGATKHQTMDTIGARASILTGQVSFLWGYPLFISSQRIQTETGQGGELIAAPSAQLPALSFAYLPGIVTAFASSGILMEAYTRVDFQQRGFVSTIRMAPNQVPGPAVVALGTDMTVT